MAEKDASYYRSLVDMAVAAGEILISSGAETYRTEDTLSRILKTSGLSRADAFVLPTGITVTLSSSEQSVSMTRRVSVDSCCLARVCKVNDISRAFCSGKITLEEARGELEKVRAFSPYHVLIKILGVMMATGFFAVLFGGNIYDGAAAFIGGSLLGVTTYFLRRIIKRDFLTDVICAATIALYAAVVSYFLSDYFPLQPQYIIVGGLMPLVPGVALTNAIRDILLGDYLSACARTVSALMTAAAVAVGVGCGLYLGSLFGIVSPRLGFLLDSDRSGLPLYLYGLVTSAFSTVGFCLILGHPKKLIIPTSFIAAVAWLVYLYASDLGCGVIWSSFAAAAVVEFLSFFSARIFKAPVTVFLIGGIIPLVPGFFIYRAVYYMFISDPSSSQALLTSLMCAGAIALGLIVMDTLLSLIMSLFFKIKIETHKK